MAHIPFAIAITGALVVGLGLSTVKFNSVHSRAILGGDQLIYTTSLLCAKSSAISSSFNSSSFAFV